MPAKLPGSLFALNFLLAALFAGPASAESIAEALAKAYTGNPTLRSERARQRATDEQVPQALAGWRPRIEAQGDIAYNLRDDDGLPAPFFGVSRNLPVTTYVSNLSIGLTQPVFRGFRTVQGVKQAEANVDAGNQNLLAVEQQVLFQAAQSYANVVRDRRIVSCARRTCPSSRSSCARRRRVLMLARSPAPTWHRRGRA